MLLQEAIYEEGNSCLNAKRQPYFKMQRSFIDLICFIVTTAVFSQGKLHVDISQNESGINI